MVYKLIRDKNELVGTCYFEFLPEKDPEKCWNDNSIFLTEESILVFEDLLYKINKMYDHYSITYYNEHELNLLKKEIVTRLNEIKENKIIAGKHYSKIYYTELNVGINKSKDEIIKMLEDLIDWLKSNEKKELTILGI
jgi:hypothetical protein